MITDGEPNDHWKPSISRVHTGEQKKSFCFFAVGVEGANMEILEQISVRKPLWLEGLKFREMFSWLSNSQQAVSRSSPGDEVPLQDPHGRPYRLGQYIGYGDHRVASHVLQPERPLSRGVGHSLPG